MENKKTEEDKPIKIFINTVNPEKEQHGLEEGTIRTSARMDMLYHTTRVKMKNEQQEDETKILDKLLQKTNSVIETVVTNISKTATHDNIKSLEFEFGIAFTEKFDLVLFQADAQQSIKFKVIVGK